MEIAGAGVWRYEVATGWKRLTPSNATLVSVDASGDVAIEIPNAGVWRWEDASGWKQLTTANATQLSIAGAGIVAIQIPSFGVWRCRGLAQLAATDPGQRLRPRRGRQRRRGDRDSGRRRLAL